MPTTTARRTREEWIALINEMNASNLTQTEWCKSHNISYGTMRSMKKKIDSGTKRTIAPKKSTRKTSDSAPQFVQLPTLSTRDDIHTDRTPRITITVKDSLIEVGIHP